MQFYQLISGNTMQYWVWNGSTLQDAGYGRYMTDAGNGTVSEATSGEPWIVAARSGGYTLQNKRTGKYLSNNSGKLAMSSTATVWQISVP